jgi:hypothetical protein
MISRYVITTEWLVDLIRRAGSDCPYTSHLTIQHSEQVDFVTNLVHSALQEIFFSIEHDNSYDYTTLLEAYVDTPKLFEACRHNHSQLRENITKVPRYDSFGDVYRIDEIRTPPPAEEILYVAFGEFHRKFVEGVVEFFDCTGGTLNTYRIAKLKSANPQLSYAVELGDDIRHVLYKEKYPNGRYLGPNTY